MSKFFSIEEFDSRSVEILEIYKTNPLAKGLIRGHERDSTLYIYSDSKTTKNGIIEFGTGICLKIPNGHTGLITALSCAAEKGLILAEGLKLIEPTDDSELKIAFKIISPKIKTYDPFDCIAKITLIPTPYVEVLETNGVFEEEE